MITQTSTSTMYPVEWDTSSPFTVFHNYDVTKQIVIDAETGEETIFFNYTQDKLSKDEYLQFQIQALQDINLTLQLALIELVERG